MSVNRERELRYTQCVCVCVYRDNKLKITTFNRALFLLRFLLLAHHTYAHTIFICCWTQTKRWTSSESVEEDSQRGIMNNQRNQSNQRLKPCFARHVVCMHRMYASYVCICIMRIMVKLCLIWWCGQSVVFCMCLCVHHTVNTNW